jgi:urea transport system substrate-binding protein
MKRSPICRGMVPTLLAIWLSIAASAAQAAEGTIKVGILHSLSGNMAISEAALKDTVLMLIADQNKKGGLLGKKLEPVVADPASDWDMFAEKAGELLTRDKVAVVFGGWTSLSRKAALPIFEQMNGLLYYPVQYEGEESSRNIFYLGSTPSQQAIPAVKYLMSKEGGNIRRWVLLGTDYLYPRKTNQILSAYLATEGVSPEDIMTMYASPNQSDWREIVESVKAFAAGGKKTAVISTVVGNSNADLYQELAKQQIEANNIPFMALSASERELRGVDIAKLVGLMATRSYFQSVQSAENAVFTKMWTDYNEQRDKTTDDPMEATLIGFRMWVQAVSQAGTVEVNAVRQAMYGQRLKTPSGFEVVMNANHHLSKPAMVGKLDTTGAFDVVWRSISPIKASVWSRYLPDSAKRVANWTYPWICGGCTEPTYKD